MSFSIEIEGRSIDLSKRGNVSKEDKAFLRDALTRGWNSYIDGLYGDISEEVYGLSQKAKDLFAFGIASRRIFVCNEKLVSDKKEEYKVGDFIVGVVCSCNPMYSFLELSIRKGKQKNFAVIEYRSHCQGEPNYTAAHLDERDPLIEEFFAAYHAFLAKARTDEERIIFWFGVNHATIIAFPNYFKKFDR